MKLDISFYKRSNTVAIAKELLGKVLVTSIDGITTGGIITETEAYCGITDKASHAYGRRFTNRTKIMYMAGGVSYVYLCYGIHHLFNVVTHNENEPHAVLIRSIEPAIGVKHILERRNFKGVKNPPSLSKLRAMKGITTGPGKVSSALGITTKHTGLSLLGKTIWIEDKGINVAKKEIEITPRIGVDYAGEDALLPYRFVLKKEFEI